MGKPITKWIADDGTEHLSERDMNIYELSCNDAKLIDLFLGDAKPRRKQEYKKLLMDWQQYVRELEADFSTYDAATQAEFLAWATGSNTEIKLVDG